MKNKTMAGEGLAVLSGTALSLICCLVLSLILSVVVSTGGIQGKAMPTTLLLVCAVAALLGGRVAVKQGSAQPIWLGLATGAALCLILLFGSVLFYGQPNLQDGGVRLLLAMGLGGGLAGLGGRKKKKKKK